MHASWICGLRLLDLNKRKWNCYLPVTHNHKTDMKSTSLHFEHELATFCCVLCKMHFLGFSVAKTVVGGGWLTFLLYFSAVN